MDEELSSPTKHVVGSDFMGERVMAVAEFDLETALYNFRADRYFRFCGLVLCCGGLSQVLWGEDNIRLSFDHLELFLTDSSVVYLIHNYRPIEACGFCPDCCKAQWSSNETVVPIERITDVRLHTQRPANNCCGFDYREVNRIEVQTAGSGASTGEISTGYVVNMREFKSAVTAARNRQSNGSTGLEKPTIAAMSEGVDIPLHGHLPVPSSAESGASLAMLTEIRDLLFCIRNDYQKVHNLSDQIQ